MSLKPVHTAPPPPGPSDPPLPPGFVMPGAATDQPGTVTKPPETTTKPPETATDPADRATPGGIEAERPPVRDPIATILDRKDLPPRESLDSAYVWGQRRRAELLRQIAVLDEGLAKIQGISVATLGKRRSCFAQYDPTAPVCTDVCRDPLCPDATEKQRPARLAALAAEAARNAEFLGHPEYAKKENGIPVKAGGMDIAVVPP